MQRSLEPKNGKDRQPTDRGALPVPTNPVIMATLRAIYAGGAKPRWQSNSLGVPIIATRHATGRFPSFREPAQLQISHPPVLYLHSPNGFRLFRETSADCLAPFRGDADVFLILMSRIARLGHPLTGIARIGLDEIANSGA